MSDDRSDEPVPDTVSIRQQSSATAGHSVGGADHGMIAAARVQAQGADRTGGTLLQQGDVEADADATLRLKCPHCHRAVTLSDDETHETINCSGCGNRFHIDRRERLPTETGELRRLGRFELLSMAGRGAFGTVYRARDTELNRIVAVKVPRSHRIVTEEDEERFLREGRAAAGLQHPGIVPIHEIARTDNLTYIVTEYVEGRTLAEFLRMEGVDFRGAAEIAAQVAEALEAAHQQGVVHRDVKPANIMLTETATESAGDSTQRGQFRARVMDFGLARRDETDVTVTQDGQILGTPAYMSPEQARGDVTAVGPHSDIYSVGVVLYEMLTGELPFRGNIRVLLKQVVEEEPQTLRRFNDRIPRDLENICLKSLAKIPNSRYATAQGLADDLRRWQRGEPVQARPVRALTRIWRWCRRRPALAGLWLTAVALLLTFAIGGPLVAWHQSRLRQQSDDSRIEAEVAKSEAEASALEAQQNLKEARTTIDKYVETVQKAELLKEERFKPLLKILLRDAREHYLRFVVAHNSRLSTADRVDLAHSLYQVARISEESGDKDEAIQAYKDCIAQGELLLSQSSAHIGYLESQARAQHDLGTLCYQLRELAAADRAFAKALRIWKRLVGEQPAEISHQNSLANTYHSIGAVRQLQDRPAEAIASLRQALTIRERLVCENPDVEVYQVDLSSSYNSIGNIYRNTGRFAEALTAQETALVISERLAQQNTKVDRYQFGLADIYQNIGLLFDQTSRTGQALSAYRRGTAIFKRLARENPTVTRYQTELAVFHNRIGLLHAAGGQSTEALVSYKEGLRIFERLAGENPSIPDFRSRLAGCYFNLGEIHRKTGNLAEAFDVNKRALDIRSRLAQEHPELTDHESELASSHLQRGSIYLRDSRPEEALSAYKLALEMRIRLANKNPALPMFRHHVASSYRNIAVVYDRANQPEKALAAVQQALTILQRLANESPTVSEFQSDLAAALDGVAQMSRKLGRMKDALAAHQRSLAVRQRLAKNNPTRPSYLSHLAGSHNQLGIFYGQTGRPKEALASYHQALKIREQLAREHPDVVGYQIDLAGSRVNLAHLLQREQPDEALKLVGKGIILLERVLKREPRNAIAREYGKNAYWTRALTFGDLARHREAADDWRRALELDSGRMRFTIQRALCQSLARSGQHAQAAALADQLLKVSRRTEEFLHLLGGYAFCAAAADRDASLKADERKRLTARYVSMAVAILKALARSGYYDSARRRAILQAGPDYNALRPHDEFRAFAKSVGVELPAWARKPRSALMGRP